MEINLWCGDLRGVVDIEAAMRARAADAREATVVELKRRMHDFGAWQGFAPNGVTWQDVRLRGADGQLAAIRYQPPGADVRNVLVHIHGGGWIGGSASMVHPLSAHLSLGTRSVVYALDYRLAPRFPFPAALRDVQVAVADIAERERPLRDGGAPLVLFGDSAGGHLALTTGWSRARQGEASSSEALVLAYPALDPRMASPSYATYTDSAVLPASRMRTFWTAFAGGGRHDDDPEFAPLLAEVPRPAQRTLVLTAERDVLRDEGEQCAALLAEAGVAVEAHRFVGQVHAFMWMGGRTAARDEAIALIAQFLASGVGGHKRAEN